MSAFTFRGRPVSPWFLVFAGVLLVHLGFVTLNLTWGFMLGHEFRQSQTALITRYIDLQNNFSLYYETPILGKPWAFPLEFPLFQWCVVLLSRALDLPHFVAARLLNIACFYAALPAFAMVLGQAGLAGPRRWLVLALALVAPIHIFYTRAFLIDTMAMMFAAWFLALFVKTMRERRLHWAVLAALAATGAGLIKSLTLFVWLVPAAIYGAWCLVQDLRRRAGLAALASTVAWGVGTVVLPGLAVRWWVHYTDAIKEGHSSAHIFTSKALTTGNFGMYQLQSRLDPATWAELFGRWRETFMPPWAFGAFILLGLAGSPRWRPHMLAATGLYLTAQLLFPYAYAFQDYYFTACTIFGVAAVGFAALGWLDSRLPRWAVALLLPLPFLTLFGSYLKTYYPMQAIKSHGGTGLSDALRFGTPPESVIVIAGADWNASHAFYAQRRALMIRNGLEVDWDYLRRAFAEIGDEDVSALVLMGNQRGNRGLLDLAATTFGLDREPTFSHPFGDVYVNLLYRDQMLRRIAETRFDGVTSVAEPIGALPPGAPPFGIAAGTARAAFPMIRPAPFRYRFTYGHTVWPNPDGPVPILSSHPDSDVWVMPPAGAREAVWEFGLLDEAWQRTPDHSDGAGFTLWAEAPDGTRRELFQRFLNPAATEADRGLQRVVVPFELQPGEALVFSTWGGASAAYDWAYWRSVEVR